MTNNEIFKIVENFNNYVVSNLGYIKNHKTGRILKTPLCKNGYPMVNLSNKNIKKTFYLHSIVANSFLNKENEKYEIDHIDGNKVNNKLDNLRFVNHSENQKNRKIYCFKKKLPASGHHHIYLINKYFIVWFRHNKLNHWSCHKTLESALVKRDEVYNNGTSKFNLE